MQSFVALSSVILWQEGSSAENPVKEQGRQCSFEVGEESRKRQNRFIWYYTWLSTFMSGI